MISGPGLIVGPHDPTDRFTYWVRRMAEGGEVLAPESPDVARTQVVDARRHGPLDRRLRRRRPTGHVQRRRAPGAARPGARRAAAARASADVTVWVPWAFLEAQGVPPWTDLPAWVPAPMAGLLAADGSKAASRRACAPADRGRGRRHRALGPRPAPGAAPGRHDPGAGGRAAQDSSRVWRAPPPGP